MKKKSFWKQNIRPIIGFSVFGLGLIGLFFPQTKGIAPMMLGFGLSYGLMTIRGD
jgi:hypothetical protein